MREFFGIEGVFWLKIFVNRFDIRITFQCGGRLPGHQHFIVRQADLPGNKNMQISYDLRIDRGAIGMHYKGGLALWRIGHGLAVHVYLSVDN